MNLLKSRLDNAAEYAQHSSEEYGFCMKYPSDWIEENVSGAAIYCDAPDWHASFNVPIPTSAQGMHRFILLRRGLFFVR
jgi:hypothetical protein